MCYTGDQKLKNRNPVCFIQKARKMGHCGLGRTKPTDAWLCIKMPQIGVIGH